MLTCCGSLSTSTFSPYIILYGRLYATLVLSELVPASSQWWRSYETHYLCNQCLTSETLYLVIYHRIPGVHFFHLDSTVTLTNAVELQLSHPRPIVL